MESNSQFDDCGGPFPMTDLQKAYYIGGMPDVLLGGTPSQAYMELSCGDFDDKKFRDAVCRLVDIHSIFRCRAVESGSLQIEKSLNIRISIYDISTLRGRALADKFLKRRRELSNAAPGFDQSSLINFSVTKLPKGKAVIHICCNGILMDGLSYEVLIRDLNRLYAGESFRITYTFRDYARYLNELKNSEAFKADRDYWEKMLDGFPLSPPLSMLTGPQNIKNPRNLKLVRKLTAEETEALASYSAENGITPFSLMLTAFAESVELYSGKTKFLINIPISARPTNTQQSGGLIGLYSNFLLFPFEDDGKKALIEKARETFFTLLDMKDHFSFQGTDAVKFLQKKSGGNIISPVIFTSIAGETLNSGAKTENNSFRKIFFDTYTSQAISETLAIRLSGGIVFNINYIENLLSGNMMSKIADAFINALKGISHGSCEWETAYSLPLPHSDSAVIDNLNNTDSHDNFKTLGELLKKSFEENADKPAVLSEDKKLTYSELFTYISRLVMIFNKFSENGEKRMGILLNKGWRQIACAAAAIYGNFAYMPIETEMPRSNIINCVRNAELSFVVTENLVLDSINLAEIETLNFDGIDFSAPFRPAVPSKSGMDDISIIINTSGSTGRPKSINLLQKGIVNCIEHTKRIFSFTNHDRLLSVTNFCHDMAIFDTLGMLIYGGAVIMPSREKQKEPEHWTFLMKKFNATVWCSVPAFVKMFFASDCDFRASDINLRLMMLGGDWIQPELAVKIKNSLPDCRLISVGGPSETTMWNIFHEVTKNDISNGFIPYGRPFPNTRYYILDNFMRPCPLGVKGTMYISGIGLAAGYAGLPDETARKFTFYNGVKVYNSGDMGRYLPDGTIEIMGRADYQVKINGKRIELGGIEHILNTMPGILSSAVVINKLSHKITAFYTSEKSFAHDSIQEYLASNLPEYMIPAATVRLSEMPLTKSGKPDRKKLEEYDIAAEIHDSSKSGGLSQIENDLLCICRELFANSSISVDDDFYSMGGDSISALKLITILKRRYNADFSVYDILNQPYITNWINKISMQNQNEILSQSVQPDNLSGIETRLSAICRNILKSDAVTNQSNLLDLGLDIQKAREISAKIKKELGADISAYKLLNMPYLSDWIEFTKEKIPVKTETAPKCV